jgi:hypothetical protein
MDIPLEQQYRERHECLDRLASQVLHILGPAHNYGGLVPQRLQLPIDEEALRAAQVRTILPPGRQCVTTEV